jgi:hypothetical protein
MLSKDMKKGRKPAPLILPDKIIPALNMDGRHQAVPLMAEDERFGCEEGQEYHPRLGHITHGHGHVAQVQAEAIAKEICTRYNSYPRLLKAIQDFVLDCDNGLGPSVERLRIAIDIENDLPSRESDNA